MGEREVDMHIVINGEAHESSNQFEVDIGLKSLAVEPVKLHVFVVLEHAVLRVEKFFADEREVLLAHTTLVDTRFAFEPSLHGAFERVLALHESLLYNVFERVVENAVTADFE